MHMTTLGGATGSKIDGADAGGDVIGDGSNVPAALVVFAKVCLAYYSRGTFILCRCIRTLSILC